MDEEKWCEMEDRIKDEKAEATPSDMTFAIFKPFGGKPLWGLTIGKAYEVIDTKEDCIMLKGCDVWMPDEHFEIKY